MKPSPLILVASAALAACEAPPTAAPATSSAPSAATPTAAIAPLKAREQAQTAPLTAAGPSANLNADPSDESRTAAWVVRVDPLGHQGDRTVKLFGTAGGDPAMNGLYSHIAFFQSTDSGWVVFRIGDFLDYRVLSERPGRVDLEVVESALDAASGDIGQRTRRVIVGWATEGDAPPTAVTLTPAR